MLRINQLKMPVSHTAEELTDKVRKLLRTDKSFEISVVRQSVDARERNRSCF